MRNLIVILWSLLGDSITCETRKLLVIEERTKFENCPWLPVNLSKAANGHGLVPWLQQIWRFHQFCWTQCFILQSSHPSDNQRVVFICWPIYVNQCIFSQWIATSVRGTNRVVSTVSWLHRHRVATCVRCERGIIHSFYNSEDSDVDGFNPQWREFVVLWHGETPDVHLFCFLLTFVSERDAVCWTGFGGIFFTWYSSEKLIRR